MSNQRLKFLTALTCMLLLIPSATTARHETANQQLLQEESGVVTFQPLMFIENVGQFDEQARFQILGSPDSGWITEDAIWISASGTVELGSLVEDQETEARVHGTSIRLSFPGASPSPRIEPFGRLDAKFSYFRGSDPAGCHVDVPVWAGLRYVDLYPGIDLEIQGQRGPGESPWSLIAREGRGDMLADAAGRLEGMLLRAEGGGVAVSQPIGQVADMVISTGQGDLVLPSIAVVDGAPLESAVPRGQALQQGEIKAASDLIYSTFIGRHPHDEGQSIAVDSQGYAYIAGHTLSSQFPTTPGAYDSTLSDSDVMVAKLDGAGSNLVYATLLGGSKWDQGRGIAIDSDGNAYVTGITGSRDYPTTSGALDQAFGEQDAFVTKLNATGTALIYSTYLGGTANDEAHDIQTDSVGNAYVVGNTDSGDFPTTTGAFDRTLDGHDVYVAKLSADGSRLLYSTFLGGSGWETGQAIALDAARSAYVTGWTTSRDLPTTPGAFDGATGSNKGIDAFAAKVAPNGRSLTYCTYLRSTLGDFGQAIAVDSQGYAYVGGSTNAGDFPTTPGAFDRTYNGGGWGGDAFLVKLKIDGTGLVFGTLFGGLCWDRITGVAVDQAGSVVAAGSSCSADLPTTPGAYDRHYEDHADVFLVKFHPTGSSLIYSTLLGGALNEYGEDMAIDADGEAYVVGTTQSPDYPATAGAFDTSYNGDWHRYEMDIFVSKVALADKQPSYQTPTPTRTNTPGPTPTRTATEVASPMPHPPMLWLQEAEHGNIHAPMAIGYDNDASNWRYVFSATQSGVAYADYSVDLDFGATFYLWARAMGLSWGENSFFLSVDGGDPIWIEVPQFDGQWTWGWYQAEALVLGAGEHTLRFLVREPNARLDALLLTNDRLYGPPNWAWEAEAESGKLTPPMRIAEDGGALGGHYVEITEAWRSGMVSFELQIPNTSNYYLWARAKGGSWNENSFYVSVDDAPDFHFEVMPDDDLWGWSWQRVHEVNQVAEPLFLTAGVHTLRFRGRESYTKLDSLLLVNDPSYAPQGAVPVPTPQRTDTPTVTATPTRTESPTATATPTVTASETATPSPTVSPTMTQTATPVSRPLWLPLIAK